MNLQIKKKNMEMEVETLLRKDMSSFRRLLGDSRERQSRVIISKIMQILSTNKKKLNEKTSSTRSNYEQDMEIVRMLLRKYGENLDTTTNFEKVRSIEKARRIHAVIDAPTDAWFHRHAVGMCRKSTKSTKSHTQKANEKSHVPQKHGGSMPTKTQTEKPKSSQGTVVPIQPKKTNRVHFKEPAVETVTYTKPPPMTPRSANADRATPQHGFKPVKQNTRGTNPTKSVGKLADKIRYWENKDI
mmetsp:Transcript_114933/g.234950  ORF Transcript_114933/g.234950 Transcript_114933/m.234950 type:complete len:243 (+) Transcript_114933:538-1266(+)